MTRSAGSRTCSWCRSTSRASCSRSRGWGSAPEPNTPCSAGPGATTRTDDDAEEDADARAARAETLVATVRARTAAERCSFVWTRTCSGERRASRGSDVWWAARRRPAPDDRAPAAAPPRLGAAGCACTVLQKAQDLASAGRCRRCATSASTSRWRGGGGRRRGHVRTTGPCARAGGDVREAPAEAQEAVRLSARNRTRRRQDESALPRFRRAAMSGIAQERREHAAARSGSPV